MHGIFGFFFDGFAQQGQGDEHGGGIIIEMNASGKKIERTVNVGGKGADGDERFHAEGGGDESGPGFSKYFGAAVKQDDAGEYKNRPGEFLDGVRGQVDEKSGIKGKGEHHHVGGEKCRDGKTDEILFGLHPQGIFFGLRRPISQSADGSDNPFRGGQNRIVFTSNRVR